jgi:hypothetical protein
LVPADAPLSDQCAALEQILRASPAVAAVLQEAAALELPGWYLGAGAVAQTVWNHVHGFDALYGIADFDLVYFDPVDRSREAEQAAEERARQHWPDLPVRLDLTNEARVHLWYEKRFGPAIGPYRSAEHAVSTWPATATCLAVRYQEGRFEVCAPFGLRDLFSLIVRPNRTLVPREVYEEKARRWAAGWPRLVVLPW